MEPRTLDATSADDAASKVSDIKIVGDGDAWVLLCKASSEKQGWMKSTKAMEIYNGGCLVQVTTQQRNPDGSYSIAEAVTYVPNVYLDRAERGRGETQLQLPVGLRMKHVVSRKAPAPPPPPVESITLTRKCAECGRAIQGDAIFCDRDCAAAYAQENAPLSRIRLME